MLGRLLILVLSVLPRHGLSRVAGALANLTVPPALRPTVYRSYCRLFGANPDEAALDFADYPSINAFFTRHLKPGQRPIAPHSITSPADAAIGASGAVVDGTLVQAKGRNYSLAALLG
ncbi:MAG: phosphatidylserine decarboxylase, partial [Polaromonas sp.]|nr:phosphatidylserine decarboxylase [Gemmatimonadaceae bacterium]